MDPLPPVAELERLHRDATYSAQSYFEAAKATAFWARTAVFLPALVAAVAGLLSALYSARVGGSISAVAGAVAATASFLGPGGRTEAYRESARRYTNLRHAARLEVAMSGSRSEQELETTLRRLQAERAAIVLSDEPVSNRFYDRAARRIATGVTSYDPDPST
ncbi:MULTISPECIES: hypothetical protein [Streptomyces]|uniref:hypothetical protein n=1 Tax=Streptomyces TaxID=1883 RepID=UPI00292E1B53|nr:hypothetical protein [Streptomyces sp. NEAU-HV9]